MVTTRLRSARTVSTFRSPRGPRLIGLPPLSRIDVTRPRPSIFAVVPRGVVTDVVRPLLSRSTTVPLARVVFGNPPFVLVGPPLSHAFFSSGFVVLPGRPDGLFDEPRRPGPLV